MQIFRYNAMQHIPCIPCMYLHVYASGWKTAPVVVLLF